MNALDRLNSLLGTNFTDWDSVSTHDLLAILVTLLAAHLDAEIFVCKSTGGENG